MRTQISGAPGAATVIWSGVHPRRGLLSAVLLLVLLMGIVLLRLTGHYPDPRPATAAADPVRSSQTWLAGHDYRLLAQLQGARNINITAVRHGDTLRGEVQTLDAGQARQIDYYRFRVRAGDVETTTTGSLAASHWSPATPAQTALVDHVTDPRWMLAPFRSPDGLRYSGRSGDAEMYLGRDGDTLFTNDGRPVQVITHSLTGGWTRTFRIDLRRSGAGQSPQPIGNTSNGAAMATPSR